MLIKKKKFHTGKSSKRVKKKKKYLIYCQPRVVLVPSRSKN